MAVSLTIQPPQVNGLDECLNFGLFLDDPGSGTIKKSVAYRLTGDGQELTEIEFMPYTGQTEEFEAAGELRKIVSTTIPTPGSNVIVQDSNILKVYSLAYGERTLDTETCDVVTNLSSNSPSFRVINSRLQYHNYIDFSANSPVVLSDKPERLPMSFDQDDWLYIYGNGNIDVRVTVYDSAGNLLLNQIETVSAGQQVFIFPVGGNNSFWAMPTNASYYDISVGSGAMRVYAVRYIMGAGCTEENEYTDIIFQEPAGGYSSLRFATPVTFSQVESSIFEQRRANCPTSGPELAQNWYNTRYDIKAAKLWTLQGSIPWAVNIDRYLDAFVQAPHHYIKARVRASGQTVYHKVNIQNGSYQTLNGTQDVQVNASFRSHHGMKA